MISELINFNKNLKQNNFNSIKGFIAELNDGECYASITIRLGHENPRLVNFCVKKELFDKINSEYNIGDRVAIIFFLSSRFKNDRWYSMANLLSLQKI
jgi:hypothetical protein